MTLLELLLGEAFWATCKAMISALCVLVVGALWGGVASFGGALLSLPVILLGGFAFATCGLAATAHAKSWEFFSYFFTFWVTPMFIFSGVFFGVDRFPDYIEPIAWILPMTHLIEVVRPWSPARTSACSRRSVTSPTSRRSPSSPSSSPTGGCRRVCSTDGARPGRPNQTREQGPDPPRASPRPSPRPAAPASRHARTRPRPRCRRARSPGAGSRRDLAEAFEAERRAIAGLARAREDRARVTASAPATAAATTSSSSWAEMLTQALG